MAKRTFGLAGLVGYLQGIGIPVKMNASNDEEEEVFEVEDEKDDEDEEEEEKDAPVKKNASLPDPLLSEAELAALQGLAQNLAKSPKLLEAFQNGTLEQALETVPAAAAMVQQNQAREKAEKDSLIAQIKANGSAFSDEELGTMATSALVKLNAQLNVNYAGLGGNFIRNASQEEPLALPSVFANQIKKAQEA